MLTDILSPSLGIQPIDTRIEIPQNTIHVHIDSLLRRDVGFC